MKRRVFILGLDGGSWNLLDRMFDAGVMPNLEQLCCAGVRATLESTMPPITPVAWTSLITGVNPGKHGVYAFVKMNAENSYHPLPLNRTDMQAPTVFDYYREGGRLISLNLPMSYPATKINGVMITGMMTPLKGPVEQEYPLGTLDRLAKAGISYVIDPKFDPGFCDVYSAVDRTFKAWHEAGAGFVERLSEIMRNRMRAARYLLTHEEWDLFQCIVVGTDRLQHVFWDRLFKEDGSAPDKILASFYAQLDEQIGKLVAQLNTDDTLLIVSDHGFVKHHGDFLTNEWLLQNDWLTGRTVRRSPLYLIKKMLNKLGITRRSLKPLLGKRTANRIQFQAGHIDYERSQAYLSSPFGIRINLRGRETLGMVEPERFESLRDEIIAKLRGLSDEDGQPLLTSVLKREECYEGDATADAADIVYAFRDDRNYAGYLGTFRTGNYLVDTPFKTGDHRVDGIFVAYGGNIKNVAEELRFEIRDVLPTTMHLNGRAVPGLCDGRVLSEILVDPGSVKIDDDWQRFSPNKRNVSLDQGQKDEITDRLKDLGYLADD